jgi:hypothetical protein
MELAFHILGSVYYTLALVRLVSDFIDQRKNKH